MKIDRKKAKIVVHNDLLSLSYEKYQQTYPRSGRDNGGHEEYGYVTHFAPINTTLKNIDKLQLGKIPKNIEFTIEDLDFLGNKIANFKYKKNDTNS